MSNTSIITNAGLALIAQLLISGDPLVITRVEAGTGADPGAPYNGMTDLVTPFEDLAGFDWDLTDNEIEIVAYYDNAGNAASVSITEVGVWAQSGASEVIYAILPMYSAADWIPAEAQLTCRSTYTIRIEISAGVDVEMFFAAAGYLTETEGDARYAGLTATNNALALRNVGEAFSLTHTVLMTGWVTNAGGTGWKVEKYVISDARIKADHIGSMFIDPNEQDNAVANMADTAAGTITLYAKATPAINFDVTLCLERHLS